MCARWNEAAQDDCFKKFVLPVESGVRDGQRKESIRLKANTFARIQDALSSALPGDVIVLSDGHYWEDTLRVSAPVRIINDRYKVSVTGSSSISIGSRGLYNAIDDEACSKCVIEMLGQLFIEKSARFTVIAGISIRRPRRILGVRSTIHVDGGNLSVR